MDFNELNNDRNEVEDGAEAFRDNYPGYEVIEIEGDFRYKVQNNINDIDHKYKNYVAILQYIVCCEGGEDL